MRINKSNKHHNKESFLFVFINICEKLWAFFSCILGLLCIIAIVAAIDKLFNIDCFWITFLLCALSPVLPRLIARYPVILFIFAIIIVIYDIKFWKILLLFLISCFLYFNFKFQPVSWTIIFIPLGICSACYAWNCNWIIPTIIFLILIGSEILINYFKRRIWEK